jgi:hypothetical protein
MITTQAALPDSPRHRLAFLEEKNWIPTQVVGPAPCDGVSAHGLELALLRSIWNNFSAEKWTTGFRKPDNRPVTS